MSATPEQIADRLEMSADATDSRTDAAELRAAAATLRAQAERVRVLESALTLAAARLDHASFVCSNLDDADLFQEARDKARAALKGEA